MRTLLAGILGLSSFVSLAQTQEPPPQQVQRSEVPPTPRHPQPAQDGGVREVLESIVIPPIPHAPFFATLATESVKYAADGASMTLIGHPRPRTSSAADSAAARPAAPWPTTTRFRDVALMACQR